MDREFTATSGARLLKTSTRASTAASSDTEFHQWYTVKPGLAAFVGGAGRAGAMRSAPSARPAMTGHRRRVHLAQTASATLEAIAAGSVPPSPLRSNGPAPATVVGYLGRCRASVPGRPVPGRGAFFAAALTVCGSQAAALPVRVALDWPSGPPASTPARARIQALRTAGAAAGGGPVEAEAGPDGVVLDLGDGV